MSDTVDFETLTSEQLIHLVQVRGQALSMHHAADHVMLEKLDGGTLSADDIKKYVIAKNEILHSLMTAEAQIIGGRQNSLAN